MANIGKSILRQIFEGKFYPYEQVVPTGSEYLEIQRRLQDAREYLKSKLDDEGSERLEELETLILSGNSIYEYELFVYGFRSGAQLVHELLADEDRAAVALHILQDAGTVPCNTQDNRV